MKRPSAKKRVLSYKSAIARKTTVQVSKRTARAFKKGCNISYETASMTADQKRLAAYELRIEGHSVVDIGLALGVTPTRVSQYIADSARINAEERAALAPKVVEFELDRIDRIVMAWYPRAKASGSKGASKAAEVLLKWLERSDKLRGLVVNRSEVSGPNGAPIQVNASNLDLSKLNDTELEWLEIIMRKAGPPLPDDVAAALPNADGVTVDGESEEVFDTDESD